VLKPLAPVASLLLGISFLLCGNGLQATLVPLRGQAEGFSAIVLGLVGSAYYAGFVLGCLAAPYLILRAGHIRAYATLVTLASATSLLHPMLIDAGVWILARAITGFSLAGLYLIIESWLNDRATNANRGLVMSAYIIVNFTTITAGQLMVTLAPIQSFNLFSLASILVSLAIVPVALTTSAQPAPIAIVQFRPLRLFRMAPVGLAGSFAIGIANGALWSLGAVYATERGLTTDGAAVFMSVAVVGGALMQWPVGRLSDRFDRRAVLAAVMAAAAVIGLLLALLPLHHYGLMAMAFVYGCVALTGYSVAAAHAYDRADKSSYVEMAAGVLLANGVGAVFGPASASWAMSHFGAGSLFVFMAMVQFSLVAYIGYRSVKRPAVRGEEKEQFDVYSTAPVGGAITPLPLEPGDPHVKTPSGFAAPVKPMLQTPD